MRQDQYAITLTIDGTDMGVWDKLEGGEVDTESVTYRPGNMGSMVSLGGSVTVGTLTVSRLYVLNRDHDRIHWLIGRAGKGSAVVNRQPLDADGNAYGRPLVYTGKVKSVTPPEVDSEGTDAALLALEIEPAGTVA